MNKTASALLVILLLFPSILLRAQRNAAGKPKTGQQRGRWVDSVYNALNENERIGQLFMVAAYSGGKSYNDEAITKLITQHQVGGLIFMQGGPVSQAMLTNKYQQMAQVPLLIAMDAEWGVGMRLDSVMSFPRQMMIGAAKDTALMFQMGQAIAYQCRRLGVHINFAPDIDINNNADNPVINSRSFGENKYWVTRLGRAYIRGLQSNGVMACVKHFPGHGNTSADSHKDLPVINRSLSELDSVELFPFRALLRESQGAMVAHLEVPALETEAHMPTTLSKNTVTGLLRKQLGYKGLIFTDALNMQGVAKYFQPGEVDLKALLAGNDVLLFSQDVPTAINRIKSALDSGLISREELEVHVKRILGAKYDYKLQYRKPVLIPNIIEDINQFTFSLKARIAAAAATMVKDDNRLVPQLGQKEKMVQYVGVNTSSSTLQSILYNQSPQMVTRWLPASSTQSDCSKALNSLDSFDINIIAIHNTSFYPSQNYKLDPSLTSFIARAQTHPKVLVLLMGNAYLLRNFCDLKSGIVMYEDDSVTQVIAANLMSGKIKPRGKIPVTACSAFPADNSPVLPPPDTAGQKVPYKLAKVDKPKSTGIIAPDAIDKLNSFINKCMDSKAFPGCRIYASQNGKVIFNKSYGYLDYNKTAPVNNQTIYDIASVTKVMATTLAVMKLYDNGDLQLNKKLKDYLPWTANSDKADITIKNLLLHQAGLKSWIPFYKETLDEQGRQRGDLYRHKSEPGFTTRVAKNLFIMDSYSDTIWKRILDQPLEMQGKYTYSDLDFYFLKEMVEAITDTALEEYVEQHFYIPMGLGNILYNPASRIPLKNVAPTEQDDVFRHQLIQGYVHDQGAALMGGVAGHAGLFATADDVGAVFEMLLNEGVYKGDRYLKSATVQLFTRYSSNVSRRGLGFDKPDNSRGDAGPAGERTSGYAFGHQGFTGTCAWADPATGIVFVFLSNRVNPTADNNQMNRLSVRTIVQDYICEACGIPVNNTRPEVYKTQMKGIK